MQFLTRRELFVPAVVLVLASGVRAQRADSVVTFNEVHYHPAEEGAPEWVELHNQMAVRIDLSKWELSAGIGFSFPEGSVIEPGGYWVVASDPAHPSLAGIENVFGPFAGRLDNGGETLRLRGRHGRIMDECDYRDGGRWPTAPDGGGVTLAKRRAETASGAPESWTWSEQAGGTPGAANFRTEGGGAQSEVIGSDTTWRFELSGDNDSSWRLSGFDDSGWAAGRGKFASGLVRNPSFEAERFTVSPGYISANGPITGWQAREDGAPGGESRAGLNTPGMLDPFSNNGVTPHGENVAFIRGGVRSLVQQVSGLEPGRRYLLGYRENGRSPTSPTGSATFGGAEVVPLHEVAAVDSLGVFALPYHHQVGAVVTATATTEELQLTNYGGTTDTILYDAIRLDPVFLQHSGSGSAAVHRALSALDDVVTLRAVLDPGTGSGGAGLGFKRTGGSASLGNDGVLWLEIDGSGNVVLRADEAGGNHVVALATGAPLTGGVANRVALIWERAEGRAAVIVNEVTVLNSIDLDATAGGADKRFDPLLGGVSVYFGSGNGSLDEVAAASGPSPATVLPVPDDGSTFRFRTEFESSGSAQGLLLSLAHTGDATVFLNGVELHRETGSGRQELFLATGALVAGRNALAIELSAGPDSTEAALEISLSVIEGEGGIARPPLRLSEIEAAGAAGFFVEIANPGPVPVSLSDYRLNAFALPDEMLAAGAFRDFPATELGFSPADEEVLFLRDAAGAVADAERVEARLRAYDEQSASWQHPAAATPGAPNVFSFDHRVVINEIHYHNRPTYPEPTAGIGFAENPTEWLELHNRSDELVDLSGWSLRDGVRYDFPDGTVLAPSGYLVIGNDQFAGNLSNGGERIQLRDANDNTADVVEYLDDFPWPKNADGRGASLELRHPDADNRDPGSWAASEESARTEWRTYRYLGRATEPPGSNNPAYFHEFLMGMLEAGEVLIDDLSVREDPDGAAIELIQNGDFEADAAGELPARWRILGNHRESEVVALPDGGKALKLTATGELEHSYNLASTTFANGRTINPNRDYEISFRAKWLGGSPQLNTRLYFNRLARTHILAQPPVTGTPGAPNSTLADGPPPAVSGVRHAPIVPAAGEPVRIRARMAAPDGVSSASVYFEAGEGWEERAMSGNDEGDYLAVLPGFPAGTVVQFYVEATGGSGILTAFPTAGAESRALFRVGDRSVGTRDVHTMRLIIRPEEANFMHTAHHTPSNDRVGATVIYNDREVWYDAGIRLRGSPYGRRGSRVGWNVKFPAGRPFRGVHETVAIDGGFSVPRGDGSGWVQVGPGVATNELVYNQMAQRAGGVPASHDDIVYVEAPRAGDDKLAQLKMARFGDIWKASNFDRGDEGTSFKFELIYHPRTTVDGRPESLKSVYDAVLGIDIRDMGPDKEAYRHNFWIQNHSDRDDYPPVISAGLALGASAGSLRAATDAVLDVDNWLRVMAFQSLTMTLDSYNNGLPHNMLLYEQPADGKVMWIPWDVDHAFYASPTTSIYGLANASFAQVVQIPANRRAYCGHLLDLCTTGFNPAYAADWISHFNEVGEMPIAAHYTQWIADRRGYVLSQLAAQHPRLTFQITTNGGNDFDSATPQVTLRGKGWIDVREIVLASIGHPLEVFWLDSDDWEVEVPLAQGANPITLLALDHGGNDVGRDSIVVTNNGTVEPASARNLVVSEIMYHPRDPTSEEVGAGFTNDGEFEFLELQNIGLVTIDLSGVAFTEGILFDFAAGEPTQLAPGGRLLVVRNRSAFELRHGDGFPVAGEFQGETALANDGERLRLEGAGGVTIRDFQYGDAHLWPSGADGDGFSLVLIDPAANPEHALPENWRHSTQRGGNPGTGDALAFTGDPSADEDGDGLSDLMNFALGGSGDGHAPVFSFGAGVLRLSHSRNLAADELRLVPEVSSDLLNWTAVAESPAEEIALGSGLSVVVWELAAGGSRAFARLRAEER